MEKYFKISLQKLSTIIPQAALLLFSPAMEILSLHTFKNIKRIDKKNIKAYRNFNSIKS